MIPWLAGGLEQGGLPKAEADRQARAATFGFQPGDIVTEVMSFGSLTPISVRVVGTDLDLVRGHARKVADQMKRIPFLRDVAVRANARLSGGAGRHRPGESRAERHSSPRGEPSP